MPLCSQQRNPASRRHLPRCADVRLANGDALRGLGPTDGGVHLLLQWICHASTDESAATGDRCYFGKHVVAHIPKQRNQQLVRISWLLEAC